MLFSLLHFEVKLKNAVLCYLTGSSQFIPREIVKKSAIIILLFSQFQESMNKTTFHKISLSQYCHITKNRAKKEAGVPRIKNPTEL